MKLIVLLFLLCCFEAKFSKKSKKKRDTEKIVINGIEQPIMKKYKYLSEVNSTSFKNLFNDDNKYVLALFCHFKLQECVPIIKEFNKIAERFEHIKFIVVNGEIADGLIMDYQIEDFPFIIFHRAHLRDRVYEEQGFSELEDFIKDGIQPVVRVIKEEDIPILERQKKITYTIMFTSQSTSQQLIEEYSDIADIFQQYSQVGFFIIDKANEKRLLNKSEQIVFYNNKAFDDISETIYFPYLDSNKTKTIQNDFGMVEWITSLGFPLFYEGSKQLVELMDSVPKKYPVVWYFDENITQETNQKFIDLSRKFRGELVFVHTDDIETMHFYNQSIFKSATIVHKNGRTLYPLNQTQFLQMEYTLEQFLNNELKPLIRSSNEEKQGNIPLLNGEKWGNGLDETKDNFIILIDNSIVSKNFVNREFDSVYKRIIPGIENNLLNMFLFNVDKNDAPAGITTREIPSFLFYKKNDNTQIDPVEGQFNQYPEQEVLVQYILSHSSTPFIPKGRIDETTWPPYIEDDEEEQQRREMKQRLLEERERNKKKDLEENLEKLKKNPFKNAEFVVALNRLRQLAEDPQVAALMNLIDWKKTFDVDIDSLEGLMSLSKNEEALRQLVLKEKKQGTKNMKDEL